MDLDIQQELEIQPDHLKVPSHHQYVTAGGLSPSSVAPSPIDQFRTWFKEVVEGGLVKEPEAISLSTATPEGIPSARMVLFKELDTRGFIFFTNYTSRKSRELLANPHAALVFYWRDVHRSVRVVGRVEKIDQKQSDEYFHSRPLESQIGAWASKQSSVVGEGEVHERLHKLQEKFGNTAPLPEFWGGWRVVPNEVEFWIGKPSRLHDRVRYLRVENSPEEKPEWKIERLAP